MKDNKTDLLKNDANNFQEQVTKHARNLSKAETRSLRKIQHLTFIYNYSIGSPSGSKFNNSIKS